MKSHQNSTRQNKSGQSKIAVIGMAYVGLPLAVEFAKQYPTTDFDIKQCRINPGDKSHRITDIKGIRSLGKQNCVIFDLKFLFDKQQTDVRL